MKVDDTINFNNMKMWASKQNSNNKQFSNNPTWGYFYVLKGNLGSFSQ